MPQNIIISNPEKFEGIKNKLIEGGAGNLHVLADFDRTFTKAFVNGEEIPSLISLLRKEKYLTPDYPAKAQKLFEKYHPIEIDPKIPPEEKSGVMAEWWSSHFKLLIESGLNKKDLEKAMNSAKSELRPGALELIDLLRDNKIPLIFMSSSGLGTDSVAFRLEKEGRLYDNVHIVSNVYEWDENGRAVGVKEPIIHCLNKNEVVLKNFPFFGEIKNRKNVLILGDSIADLDMIEGFEYDNLLSVGFLNKNMEENLENYKKAFDAVITNDGEMTFVYELMKELTAAG